MVLSKKPIAVESKLTTILNVAALIGESAELSGILTKASTVNFKLKRKKFKQRFNA
jgi:hypothetical protein